MKIGVLSDTHNNIPNAERALAIFRERGVERLIHCGDVTHPDMIKHFAGWKVDFTFGNIDSDRSGLRKAILAVLQNSSIAQELRIEIAGATIAAIHGDHIHRLDELLISGQYDYVFHGHSHERRDDRIDSTRVINPGALGGRRPQTRSVCVVDLATGEAEFVEVE